jgi:hypothetical protein
MTRAPVEEEAARGPRGEHGESSGVDQGGLVQAEACGGHAGDHHGGLNARKKTMSLPARSWPVLALGMVIAAWLFGAVSGLNLVMTPASRRNGRSGIRNVTALVPGAARTGLPNASPGRAEAYGQTTGNRGWSRTAPAGSWDSRPSNGGEVRHCRGACRAPADR